MAAIAIAMLVPLFLGALGSNPARFEELKIGGGLADPVDGGAEIEKDGDLTTTGVLTTSASTATRAGVNVPHGTAPSSPTNGDLWSTTGGFYARVNGSTVGPFGVATAGDVLGPGPSVTDNVLARFNGTGGYTIQGSNVTISDDDTLVTVASDTTAAGLRLPHGTAPSSPTNGDVWTTTAGLYGRINGGTVGPYLPAPASSTDNALARYNGTAGLIQDSNITLSDDDTLVTVASDTTAAGLRVPHGTAPSSPTNGDVWTTTSGLYFEINGSTIGPIADGSGDVTAAASIADNAIVRGDGGVKGVQTSGVSIDDNGQLSATGIVHQFGSGSGAAYLYINGGAAQNRGTLIQTGGLGRWDVRASNDAESGADAGSDFQIAGRDDAGTAIDTYFSIERATGDVTIPYLLGLGSTPITVNDSAGNLLLSALEDDGASDGYVIAYDSGWTAKAYTKTIFLTADGAKFPTSNPAVGKDLDANDDMVVEFGPSDNCFWANIAVPEDYDGSVESIKVYWYKATDTNAVTWTLSNNIRGDSTVLNQAYTGGGSNSGTPEVGDLEITTITDADILGTASDVGKHMKILLTTDAFSGDNAFLLMVKLEY